MKEQYNNAVRVLKDWRVTDYPSLESIETQLTDKQRIYIEKNGCFLVITPPKSLYEIIKLFDKDNPEATYIYKSLWDQYDLGSDWLVEFVIPEAKFKNQSSEKQHQSLLKEKKSCKGLKTTNPRSWCVAQAILRKQAKTLLNYNGWQRLDLPTKQVDGDSLVGLVYSDGDQLRFDWSFGYAYPFVGVGLSVRLDISDFEPSGSSIPFSNEIVEQLKRLNTNLERIFK